MSANIALSEPQFPARFCIFLITTALVRATLATSGR